MDVKGLKPVVLIFLFVALFGCGLGGDLTDAEYLDKGRVLFDEGKYPAAAIQLKNSLQKNSDNLAARVLLGRVYLELGYGEGANKELRKARELGLGNKEYLPLLARAMLLQHKHRDLIALEANLPTKSREYSEFVSLQGLASLELGDFEKARKDFDIALGVDPRNVTALIGKARDAGFHAKYEEARGLLKQVIEIDPDNAMAWRVLGDLEKITNNYDKAEEAFSRAISGHYYNLYDLLQRADVRIKLGKYDQALSDVDSLRKRFPKSKAYNYPLGIILYQQGKLEEAMEPLSEAASTNSIARYYLALANLKQGGEAEAERLIRQVVAQDPRFIPARIILAKFMMRRNEYKKAINLLRPIIAQGHASVDVVKVMSNALLRTGRADESITLLQQAVESHPDTLDLQIQLASSLIAIGKKDEGVGELQSLMKAHPDYEPSYLTLAMVYLGSRDYAAADTLVSQYREHFKDSLEPFNLSGLIALKRGDLSAAEKHFNEVLRADPDNTSARTNLAVIAVRRGDYASAVDYYGQVVERHPRDTGVLVKLSDLYEKLDEPKKSMELLERVVEIDPENQLARARLANLLLQEGRLGDAKRALGSLNEKQPGYEDALGVAISIDLALNNGSDALAKARQLAKLQPHDPRSFYLLALAEELTGDKEGLLKHLLQARTTGEGYDPASIAYGRALIRRGDIDQAENILSEIPEASHNRPEYRLFEAELLASKGDVQQALKIYGEVFRKYPSRGILGDYITLLEGAGQGKEAIRLVSGWLKKHPDDTEFMIVLAALHSLAGDGKAQDLYEKVVESDPRNVIALNNLAWSLRDQNLQRAIGYAEIALNVAPETPFVKDTLGVLLTKSGDYERAVGILSQAVAAAPGNTAYKLHYAEALAAQGQSDKAVAILRDIMSAGAESSDREAASRLLQQIASRQ